MADETDLSQEKAWWHRNLAEKAVASLRRRMINAQFVPTAREALGKVLELIPEGATVGWGDSVTLEQVGVFDELKRARPGLLFDPFQFKENGEFAHEWPQRRELMEKALNADVFLSGVNAITIDGRLVSVDHTGNRVAATLFGPKRVILVAGANKIVSNLDEALKRVKQAAAINARRHVLKHHLDWMAELPCAKTGVCVDCYHPSRLCHYTIIIEGERPAGVRGWVQRLNVIIIGEELGI